MVARTAQFIACFVSALVGATLLGRLLIIWSVSSEPPWHFVSGALIAQYLLNSYVGLALAAMSFNSKRSAVTTTEKMILSTAAIAFLISVGLTITITANEWRDHWDRASTQGGLAIVLYVAWLVFRPKTTVTLPKAA